MPGMGMQPPPGNIVIPPQVIPPPPQGFVPFAEPVRPARFPSEQTPSPDTVVIPPRFPQPGVYDAPVIPPGPYYTGPPQQQYQAPPVQMTYSPGSDVIPPRPTPSESTTPSSQGSPGTDVMVIPPPQGGIDYGDGPQYPPQQITVVPPPGGLQPPPQGPTVIQVSTDRPSSPSGSSDHRPSVVYEQQPSPSQTEQMRPEHAPADAGRPESPHQSPSPVRIPVHEHPSEAGPHTTNVVVQQPQQQPQQQLPSSPRPASPSARPAEMSPQIPIIIQPPAQVYGPGPGMPMGPGMPVPVPGMALGMPGPERSLKYTDLGLVLPKAGVHVVHRRLAMMTPVIHIVGPTLLAMKIGTTARIALVPDDLSLPAMMIRATARVTLVLDDLSLPVTTTVDIVATLGIVIALTTGPALHEMIVMTLATGPARPATIQTGNGVLPADIVHALLVTRTDTENVLPAMGTDTENILPATRTGMVPVRLVVMIADMDARLHPVSVHALLRLMKMKTSLKVDVLTLLQHVVVPVPSGEPVPIPHEVPPTTPSAFPVGPSAVPMTPSVAPMAPSAAPMAPSAVPPVMTTYPPPVTVVQPPGPVGLAYSGPSDVAAADAERERQERFTELADIMDRTLLDLQDGEEKREQNYRANEEEREKMFTEAERRRDMEAQQRREAVWKELEDRLAALPPAVSGASPVPPPGEPPAGDVPVSEPGASPTTLTPAPALADDAASIVDSMRAAAERHAQDIHEVVRLEREAAQAERERAQELDRAERDRMHEEYQAHIRALESELSAVRKELEDEKMARATEEAERHERERAEMLEQNDMMRNQLGDLTNLVTEQRDEIARKRELADQRWETKQARWEQKDEEDSHTRNMLETILANQAAMMNSHATAKDELLAEMRDNQRQALDAIEQQRIAYEGTIREMAEAWRADCERHKNETIEAVKATANEQIPYNVQGYLDEFSRSLATEVRMLLSEVGKLREDKRNLEYQIGELLKFKAKYGPGGEFDPSWKPAMVCVPTDAAPQPEPAPPEPEPEVPQQAPSAWRTLPTRGSRRRRTQQPAPQPPPEPQPAPTTQSWATWQPDPAFRPSPPIQPVEHLLAPPQGSPGLFGPRSPRDSVIGR
ncbi:hypothetical protein DICSQDRAFT_169744 [Dichomitus squalens LYAD-421 SS1]|uniref:Uncharacterized protein n=1 Tax=Dichomitus squalens (strain LYAD-421) TaxID=732165 RepID=R7T083_DICSQ|nr:uncharacterized protein DICSQDRAFT_169744 [Dichomitus squalens LYAD-421 SS1]EJF61726.1 hypothetical protein DICSQDRAFT_169744 [Dichomitus squalens LYAD-421 SS1]